MAAGRGGGMSPLASHFVTPTAKVESFCRDAETAAGLLSKHLHGADISRISCISQSPSLNPIVEQLY
jgi:hypothetical protein